ncbi:6-hydroxynicotinate 3-monooxygenase precursor [Corynebacterium faecale]|uniref:NAD(P)/FAD-dependent oxidoreductase n=1 Tax=Corynebacterium faecale TaxID=1758466 RepID=UPI0025B5CAE5|nr:NAD(P)/FAD-dependent oxidoreductase [Corynebacterium faecale]WJY91813.1 6-hydroxynicotinate 3-monooxygenase precursor [Corynebacterium faecale]
MKTEDIKNLKIGVIGGGYAGATAGLALAQIGANVKVYEQAHASGEVGAGIGLRPASVKLFKKLGIFPAIEAVTSPSDYFEILDAQGNRINLEEWPHLSEGDEKHNTRMIHRRDFIDALTSQLPEGVLQYGYKAEEITDNGDSATVKFTNGEVETFDILVGADGIKSKVRTLWSDSQPVMQGAHAYRAVIDGSQGEGLLVDDNLRLYLEAETGRMIYFLPLRHRGENGQISFDITVPHDDLTWNPNVSKDEVLEMLKNFDERLIKIVEKLDWEQVNQRAAADIDPQDKWNSDAVVLIGDAAHAMLHHQGQGANSAVIDAGALADCIVEADTVAEALALYTAQRKEPVQELQRISRESWNAESAGETAFPEKDKIDY